MGVDTPGKETSSMWEIYAVSPHSSDIEEAICSKRCVYKYVEYTCAAWRLCKGATDTEGKGLVPKLNSCFQNQI